MLIYGLKNCDNCRKALRAFPNAKLVDVREIGVPDATLSDAFDSFGDALLNTRSTTWRSLSEDEKKGAPLNLVRSYPALMKRPLIDVDGALFLGWNSNIEADVKAVL